MRYKAAKGDIDAEVALLQGANALDAAAEAAERTGDVEGLLNVAAMWMKFSEAITQFVPAEDEATGNIPVRDSAKIEVGFQRTIVEPIVANEEDEIDE